MSPELWQQIERIYHEALSREPSERSSFLDEACAGNEALRGEVESLLGYDEPARHFIDEPAIEIAARQHAEDRALKLIGRQIGSYRILSRVGAGGMGEVYLAEDETLDRKVAIKFLSQESQTDEQTRMRLIREAQAAAKLDHPNVCAIHEVGRHEGQSFIVMQYVEGETLAARISSQPMTPADVLDAATQIASAMSEAHSHGIIHRDIKPQNIMLTRRGQIKVLDFGLAKLEAGQLSDLDGRSEVNTQPMLTQPGVIPGTVPYMSPEQLRGEVLDARSDIFSFGAVLYEMLTCHRPFGGDNQTASITAILNLEPSPLTHFAQVPQDLQRIVNKCLEKDRERRYQSAQELTSDLKAVSRSLDPDNVATKTLVGLPLRSTPRSSRIRWLLAAAALLLIAVTIVMLMPTPARTINSLAVLPLLIDDADPSIEYLGDAIPERLINKLAELQSLKVIARASSFKYKGSALDAQEIGKKLGVQAILSLHMARRGNNLLISAELVDVSDNHSVWGDQYSVKESDLLELERIPQAISEKLRLKLTASEKDRLARRATENPEAYQLYLKGRASLNKLIPDRIEKAIDQFQQAIQKDPNYALAYAGLADCYSLLSNSTEARRAATEALTLDNSLGEAHESLGLIKWFYDWDWRSAESEYKSAIELNPNSPSAHERYALLLAQSGRHEEAIREARRAQEIDPVTPLIAVNPAQVFVCAHDYKQAEEELHNVLDLEPRFATALVLMALVYERTGRYKEAVDKYQEIIEQSGNTPEVRAGMRALMGNVYAKAGNRTEALKILDEAVRLGKAFSYLIAQIYANLGDRQHALEWLDKAVQAHDVSMLGLKTEQAFENFHQEPQFVDLLRRVGLEP